MKESDINVKLIVLDRLTALKDIKAHERVLQVTTHAQCMHACTASKINYYAVTQNLLMDVLRVLSSPSLEVRKKTLGLVLDLVNSRNVEEVRRFLKVSCSIVSHCCAGSDGFEEGGDEQ